MYPSKARTGETGDGEDGVPQGQPQLQEVHGSLTYIKFYLRTTVSTTSSSNKAKLFHLEPQ